ncbi:MAG: MFS transporter [Alphaproteobacteria bacterium]|nr:MFS transporter [Alphaproteobacteria bacterium]
MTQNLPGTKTGTEYGAENQSRKWYLVGLIGVMGFNSGLPLALTASTLVAWLKLSGLSLPIIGLFSAVGLAYNLKFLWAPLFDNFAPPVPPFLMRNRSRRMGWMLVIGIALALSMVGLGLSAPDPDHWRQTFLAASFLAFCSASFDCVIDAWRVENVPPAQMGLAAATTQYGYRMGMLLSGAGGLWLSTLVDWPLMFALMAAILLISLVIVLVSTQFFAPAPPSQPNPTQPPNAKPYKGLVNHILSSIYDPLKEFAERRGWWIILLMIVLYKVGEAVAAVMSLPFYLELGYDRGQIAAASKLFGLVASLAGVALGGILVLRWGRFAALLGTGIAQALATLAYLLLLDHPPDTFLLAITVTAENLTAGMASSAMVAYLSALCSLRYSATHYALLSALAGVGRTLFAASGGVMVTGLGWAGFFIAMTIAAVPGLILVVWLRFGRGLDGRGYDAAFNEETR